jgi:hypothetical protein
MLKLAIKGNYHYYHLLSGVDFPLKTQDDMHEFFDKQVSEFISYHKDGYDGDSFLYKIRYYFPLLKYVGKGDRNLQGVRGKLLRKLGIWQDDMLAFQERKGIDRCRKDKGIIHFKGDQWFSITDSFARYIVSKEKEVLRRYRLTNGPDEFFVPTLAMNSEFAKNVRNNSLREIDWNRGNPYEYTIDDLNMLETSDNLFARKLSYDKNPELVEAIIEHLHHKKVEK